MLPYIGTPCDFPCRDCDCHGTDDFLCHPENGEIHPDCPYCPYLMEE